MKWSVEVRKNVRETPELFQAATLEEVANFVAMEDCSSFRLVSEIGNPDYYTRILEKRVAELRQALALLVIE